MVDNKKEYLDHEVLYHKALYFLKLFFEYHPVLFESLLVQNDNVYMLMAFFTFPSYF